MAILVFLLIFVSCAQPAPRPYPKTLQEVDKAVEELDCHFEPADEDDHFGTQLVCPGFIWSDGDGF